MKRYCLWLIAYLVAPVWLANVMLDKQLKAMR